MDIEVILKHVGSFGKYQWFVLIVAIYCYLSAVLVNICFMVFGKLDYPDDCYSDNRTQVRNNCEYFHSVVTEWNLTVANGKERIPYLLDSIQMVGYLFGAIVAGHFSDMYGRKKVWFLTILFMSLSGGLSGLVGSWEVLLVFRPIVGFCAAAFITCAVIITTEITSKSNRFWVIAVYVACYEIGFVWFAILAYVTQWWRAVTLIANLQLIPALVAFYWILESPRWLYQGGQLDKCRKVLQAIGHINGYDVPDRFLYAQGVTNQAAHAEVFRTLSAAAATGAKAEDTAGEKTAKPSSAPPPTQIGWGYLFSSWEKTRVIMGLIYCAFASYAVLYGLLFNAGDLFGNKYINVSIYGLIKVIPAILLVLAERYLKIGRRTLYVISFGGTSSCMLVVAVIYALNKVKTYGAVVTGVTMLGSCFVIPGIAASFLYPVELFPTMVRNRANGLTSTCARMGAILAPQMLFLRMKWPPLPFFIFCFISLLGLVPALFILPETRGRPLPEMEANKEECGEMLKEFKSGKNEKEKEKTEDEGKEIDIYVD